MKALSPLFAVALLVTGCTERHESEGRSVELFLAGDRVASISERVDGRVVERESEQVDASGRAHLRAVLDDDGLVREATYRREGDRGEREVTLARQGDRAFLVTSDERRFPLPAGPLLLLETLHIAAPAEPTQVTFLDLASAETLPGSVRREGEAVVALDEHGGVLARAFPARSTREGPGAFFEGPRGKSPPSEKVSLRPRLATPAPSQTLFLDGLDLPPAALALDGPGQSRLRGRPAVKLDPRHRDTAEPPARARHPAPFLESDDASVRAFAAEHARGGTVAAEALSLAEAIFARLDTSKAGGPPSAVTTLERSAGDCDDATALLVAALRARGHAARPVVGYRALGGRLSPHAWGEVYTADGWLPVDALVPGLGPFSTHLRLFEGLGSSLTVGRVLGKLRPRLAGRAPAE